jgi:hypothetical protein
VHLVPIFPQLVQFSVDIGAKLIQHLVRLHHVYDVVEAICLLFLDRGTVLFRHFGHAFTIEILRPKDDLAECSFHYRTGLDHDELVERAVLVGLGQRAE